MTKHDQDVYAWAEEQTELLITEQFDKLDLRSLADETLMLAAREQQTLSELVAEIIICLLLGENAPGAPAELELRRGQLQALLARSPSLKSCLKEREFLNDAYDSALDNLPLDPEEEPDDDAAPAECPYALEQILGPDIDAGPRS